MTFGNRLREARETAGLTQKELGKQLRGRGTDVTQSKISEYELGTRYPPPRVLRNICIVLRVSADWLLDL